jgi:hypothetical protein
MNLKMVGIFAAMAAFGLGACTVTSSDDDDGTTTSLNTGTGDDTDTAPDTDTDTGEDTGTDTGEDTDTETGEDTETETATETETEEITGPCAESFCNGDPADNECFACLQEAALTSEDNGGCQEPWLACAQDTDCAAFFGGTGGDYNDPLVQDVGDCMCQPGVCLDE